MAETNRPTRIDALYLSPHLDDAALSCGGQIAQRTAAGQRVLIVTIMAGDPPQPDVSDYARSLHDRWALASDAVATRRTEDLAACRRLGAQAQHWSVPDCIYRRDDQSGEPFYLSDVDIFDRVAPAEMALVAQLSAQMRLLPASGRVLAPLAAVHRVHARHAGRHVDHQLTRMAAEAAFGERLTYYEDYPYVQEPGALDSLIPADGSGWRAGVIPLSNEALAAKIEAILAFRSQLSTFWQDRADLEAQVMAYARRVGGERVWERAEGPQVRPIRTNMDFCTIVR